MDEPGSAVALIVRAAVGGMAQHVTSLANGLPDYRWRPQIFAPRTSRFGDLTAAVSVSDIDIRASPHPFADWLTANRLAKQLHGFSLVHAHGIRGAMVAARAARYARIPCLVTAHNTLAPSPAAGFVARLIARSVHGIVAVSNAVAESYISAGIDPQLIEVISNGVDTQRFRPAADRDAAALACGLDPTRPILVAVSRLSREKGIDVLLAAFEMVSYAEPGTQLLIIGDGPDSSYLHSMKTEGVTFRGHVARPEVAYCAATMAIVPSRSEGQGLVALEAMACGLPVVASAVGGLRETVVAGLTGDLVPPDDALALAAAIVRLIRSPDVCGSYGQEGRNRVTSLFDLDSMIRLTADAYSRAVGLKGRVNHE